VRLPCATATVDKALAELKGMDGTVGHTSYDETKEALLREALADRHAAQKAAQPPTS
jgi:uncharacterized membrane protein